MKRTFFALLLVCIISIAFCQDNSDLATYPGQWILTNNNLSNEWFGERYYKMNAAELEKYHKTTDKLVSYLHRQPVAQRPVGVTLNVSSQAAYNHYDHELYPVKPGERVKAEVFIPFCSLIHRNDKVEYACDEVPYIQLVTNDERQAYEPAMNLDALDDKKAMMQYGELFFLPKKLLDLGGGVCLYDGYYDNWIVVARQDRPFWIPVTNREYLNRMMIYFAAMLKEERIPQMAIDAIKREIASIPPEMMDKPAYLNGNMERPLTQICSMEEDSTAALYKINPPLSTLL